MNTPPVDRDPGVEIVLRFTPEGTMPDIDEIGKAAAWCMRRGRYPIGAALAVLAEAIEAADAAAVLTVIGAQTAHPRMAKEDVRYVDVSSPGDMAAGIRRLAEYDPHAVHAYQCEICGLPLTTAASKTAHRRDVHDIPPDQARVIE